VVAAPPPPTTSTTPAAATAAAAPSLPSLLPAAPTADTLRLVMVVFRHGARTPLSSRTHLYEHVDWTGCCAQDHITDLVRLDLQKVAPAGAAAAAAASAAAGSSSSSPATDADAKQRATILKGGCHKGELTLLGKDQALGLGRWLRERYAHGGPGAFLPPAYAPGCCASRTTSYARTRGTLRGVLAGLWPELAREGAPSVPAHTASDLDEILFADSRACPHLAALLEASADLLESKKRRERARIDKAQRALTARLRLPEGYWARRWSVTDLHDVATSLPAHGRPLAAHDGEGGGGGGGGGEGGGGGGSGGGGGGDNGPRLPHWLEDEVNRLATAEFSHFVAPSLRDAHGGTVLRLSMGRLLDSLLARMDEAVAASARTGAGAGAGSGAGSTPHPPLRLYAGHDSTVLPLLVAVGGRDVVRWPPYCSNVVLELHEVVGAPAAAGAAPAAAGAADTSGAPSPPPPGRWFVRALFNGEPLPLGAGGAGEGGGAGAEEGAAVPLETFRREVLAPFLLSDADHRLACARPLTHDGPLPQPAADGE